MDTIVEPSFIPIAIGVVVGVVCAAALWALFYYLTLRGKYRFLPLIRVVSAVVILFAGVLVGLAGGSFFAMTEYRAEYLTRAKAALPDDIRAASIRVADVDDPDAGLRAYALRMKNYIASDSSVASKTIVGVIDDYYVNANQAARYFTAYERDGIITADDFFAYAERHVVERERRPFGITGTLAAALIAVTLTLSSMGAVSIKRKADASSSSRDEQ